MHSRKRIGPDPTGFLLASAGNGDGVAQIDAGVWLISDPGVTEYFLARGDTETARDGLRTAVTDWGPGGLAAWMSARRLMQPVLTTRGTVPHVPAMANQVAEMVASWPRGDIDALAEATRLIARVNVHYVLGDSAPAVSTAIAEEISIAELPRPRWAPLARLSHRSLIRAQRRTCEAIAEHIRSRPDPSDHRGLIDELTSQETGLDERSVALAIPTMLLAGYRVPAAALTWVWYELATHPDIQDRVRGELAAVGRPGEPDALDDLPLCRAVIRETLRLHPPLWQFQRRLTRSADVGARTLPAGTTLLFSSYVNQRAHPAFPDPDRFRPERWLTGEPHWAGIGFPDSFHSASGMAASSRR